MGNPFGAALYRTAWGLVAALSLAGAAQGWAQAERTPALPELPRVNLSSLPESARATIHAAFDAVAAQSNDAAANGRVGMLLHAWGFPAEAEVCYQRARLLDSASFRWIYYLALAKTDQGNWAAAVTALNEALRLNPQYVPAQLKLGGLLLALGKWQDAAQLFEALVKAHPGSAEAFYGLGRVRAVLNDLDGAVASLRKACELFPEYGAAHYALAQTYKRQGNMDLALEQLALHEKTANSAPDSGDPLVNEILALNAGAPDALRQGLELARQGKLEEAATALENALQSNPGLVEAHVQLISLYGQRGQFSKAEEHFQAAAKLDPKNAGNSFNHGLLFASQGRFAEAEGEFRKTLELDPSFPAARTNLGLALEAQQKLAEAGQELRRAAEANPLDLQAHFALGRILVNQENYEEGIQHLLKCVESPEDANRPAYLYALGAAYARSGDTRNGLHYLREARDAAAKRNLSRMAESIDEDLRMLQRQPPPR